MYLNDATNVVLYLMILQIKSLNCWMSVVENGRLVPGDLNTLIQDQLQSNEIGIKGSGIFTVTYAVIANVNIFTEFIKLYHIFHQSHLLCN